MGAPCVGTNLPALLRRRVPALLWFGQVASTSGDRLYGIALLWIAARLTHSASAVAGVAAADTAPFLIASTVSGWVGDRLDGVRLARNTDLLRAAMVAVLPALYLFRWLTLAALVAVAIALSAAEAFFLPALQASLPRLVRPGELTGMVSLLDTTDRLGRVLGPGLVGVLTVLPEIHLFTVDAVTFLLSAASLTLVLRRLDPPRGPIRRAPDRVPSGRMPDAAELLAGWRETIRRSALRNALAVRTACNLAWPAYTIATPFVVADRYRSGIGGYGLVLAAFGVGNLLGAVLAPRIRRDRLARTGHLAWAGAGAGFLGLAGAPSYLTFLGFTAAVGACTPLANVTVNAAIAGLLPADVLARAYAAQRTAVVGAGLAGLPLAAAVTSRFGAGIALGGAGIAILITAATALIATDQ